MGQTDKQIETIRFYSIIFGLFCAATFGMFGWVVRNFKTADPLVVIIACVASLVSIIIVFIISTTIIQHLRRL
jgi:cation transporter-like permease